MQIHTNVTPLFSESYLDSLWKQEFDEYRTTRDSEILEILKNWSARTKLIETVDEGSLQSIIFNGLLGYRLNGEGSADLAFTMYPQFPVARAGQTGGTGKADLALGNFFGLGNRAEGIPQVLCEFKDGRSGLDAAQNRKGNNRSPVKQCFDYLREAANALYGHEPVRPTWGVVTDMNEFRLYHRSRGPSQYERFFVSAPDEYGVVSMISESDAGAYQRFLFSRLLSEKMLLAQSGKSPLERLLDEQWIREKVLEKEFYLEYDSYRKTLLEAIQTANPDFSGTPGTLVRLTQRLLDRCLFLLFCEDMGTALQFPRDLVRNMLVSYSQDPYYASEDMVIWDRLRALFKAMEEGGSFFGKSINKFNGGLFRSEPQLESLRIPTQVFCARNQGAGSEANLKQHKDTLLYFAATYNFGVERHGGEQVIDPYALGRIFEQSITELEIMEAEADNRESINKLSKRKRDGVYYTPERITAYIVQETVGARCEDLKQETGLADLPMPTIEEVKAYALLTMAKQRTSTIGAYLEALRKYENRLDRITVVDPACGSGAFLVQAFDFLCRERRWIAAERERVTGTSDIFDLDSAYKATLSNNIYGVDINPESVEITRLALWLHTTLPGQQLTSLDASIKCGNSLVGADFAGFYRDKHNSLFGDADERDRERINAFDWQATFPDVFARGGFDCVIGNPPYVKLQNFRKVEPDVAEYLATADAPEGGTLYRSTRSGNFDLYLPFIEKGIALMNPEGRMGYIAPSLWTKNEYGESLRGLLKETRTLDRWIDFGHHQIFDEAITYTSLQFFRAAPSEPVRCAFAHDGDISAIDWALPTANVSYEELPAGDPWYLLPDEERRLITRLLQSGTSLIDYVGENSIVVGLQTSADHIYHLRRKGDEQYIQTVKEKGSKKPVEITVEIEDEIMHPLVSGKEARRYQKPLTETFILFPYDTASTTPRLYPEAEMRARFPKAWKYLTSHETDLRGREKGKMDKDTTWWGYVYPKNLDRQESPKLLVPRLVLNLFCAVDARGEFYLDNVDVGGIVATNEQSLWYLAAIMNAPVANFVWKRISKPFQHGYLAANKQFIAPLPIPVATEEQQTGIGTRARALQELHTAQRDERLKIDRRLDSAQPAPRAANWIWPELRENAAAWKADAPGGLTAKEKTAWAKERHAMELSARIESIDGRLRPGMSLLVTFVDGELSLAGNGTAIIDGIYLDEDGEFIAAQWRHVARSFNVTDGSGKRLLDRLLALRSTANPALAKQVIEIDRRIMELEKTIASREREMNEIVFGLYRLSEEERRVVTRG